MLAFLSPPYPGVNQKPTPPSSSLLPPLLLPAEPPEPTLARGTRTRGTRTRGTRTRGTRTRGTRTRGTRTRGTYPRNLPAEPTRGTRTLYPLRSHPQHHQNRAGCHYARLPYRSHLITPARGTYPRNPHPISAALASLLLFPFTRG